MKAFLICVLGATLIALSGCPNPPHTNVPNVGKIIGEFRAARDTCHEYASIAKGRVVLARRLQEGHDYYARAKGSNNKVIASIVVAIQTNDPLTREELKKMLVSADSERQQFQNWYVKVPGRRQSHVAEGAEANEGPVAAAGPVDVVIKLAELAVEIIKLQDKRFTEQRKELLRELRRCEWKEWNSIAAQK